MDDAIAMVIQPDTTVQPATSTTTPTPPPINHHEVIPPTTTTTTTPAVRRLAPRQTGRGSCANWTQDELSFFDHYGGYSTHWNRRVGLNFEQAFSKVRRERC